MTTKTPAAPKPKQPTQTERIQAKLETTRTADLLNELSAHHSSSRVFDILDASRDSSTAVSLREAFGNAKTGGVSLYGTELPLLPGMDDLKLDTALLGKSYAKYQSGRKAMALALEHMNKVEASVQADITKRVNGLIRAEKGGTAQVRTFHRNLKVTDLELFTVGKPTNRISYQDKGITIELGTQLPAQVFDITEALELIGEDFDEITATKLLQKEISVHTAHMNNHMTTIAMAAGLDPDPSAGQIRRILTVEAMLWHGTSTVTPRQWRLVQRGEGRINRKSEEVLSFMPLDVNERLFDGAGPGLLVLNVTVGYRLRVKKAELDAVIDGLGYLTGSEWPVYLGVAPEHTLAEHLNNVLGDEDGDEEVPAVEVQTVEVAAEDTPEADALLNSEIRDGNIEDEDEGESDPQAPDISAEDASALDAELAEIPAEPAPSPEPVADPSDGDTILF